jgi:hypothetical protein
LEEAEIAFDVRDKSEPPRYGLNWEYNGPRVALNLVVRSGDLDYAKSVLRKGMGLFPLPEVRASDGHFDQDGIVILGEFGQIEDTKEIARILEEAKYWYRVERNPKASLNDEDYFWIEVKEKDLDNAMKLVQRALDIREAVE